MVCLTSINQIYAADAGYQADDCLDESIVATAMEDSGLSDDSLAVEPDGYLASSDMAMESDNPKVDTLDSSDAAKESDDSRVDTKLSTDNPERAYYQDEIDYYVKLLDEDGNPLNDQELSLVISNDTYSKSYSNRTDGSGIAAFHLPLDIGTFVVKGSFEGDSTYNPSVLNGNLTVLPTIESSDLNVYTFNREPFVVTVFKSNGDYSGNTKVTFAIAGQTYEAVTDYFGKAELNINLDPGTYLIRTTANGFSVENRIVVTDYEFTVNRRNFYTYFTRDGVLKEEYSNAVLEFVGNFEEYGIITINAPAYLKGSNANFTNTVFHLNADGITLEGINMYLNDSFEDNEYAGILIDANDVTVSNVFMNISACDKKTLGIYSYGYIDEPLSNLKLVNNTIVFNADGNGPYYWGLALTYTDSALVSDNNITCSLPLRSVNWAGGFYGGISSDSVAGVAVQSSMNLRFQNNYVKVVGNSNQGYYPTLDAVLIHSCDNAIIFNNTIIEEDFNTPNGTDNYLYALDVYMSNNVKVLSNEIHVNTTGGKLAAGTAYGIQVSGPLSDFVIAYNNISTINNGPNIGIYSQNSAGDTSLFIYGNTINVTGLAGEHNWALVAGIEVQDTNDTIWNNTIEVHNLAGSTSGNAYGVSYSQNTSSNHTYDIQYNKIKTDSNYAVYINASGTIRDTNVSNNVLVTGTHEGDDAVYVAGDGNYVGGNTGDESASMPRVPQWLADLLNLMDALNSNGTGHSNSTGNGTGFFDNGGNQSFGNSSGTNVWPFNGNENGNGTHYSNNHNANQKSDSDVHYAADVDDLLVSEREDSSPGLSGNPIAGSPSSAGLASSSPVDVDKRAYEIDEKDNLAVKSTDYMQLGFIVLAALLLLVLGYKRQKDREEEE